MKNKETDIIEKTRGDISLILANIKHLINRYSSLETSVLQTEVDNLHGKIEDFIMFNALIK